MKSDAVTDALKRNRDIPICPKCAEDAGGVWPQYEDASGRKVSHAATFHGGQCAQCGKERAVCAMSDWNWPGRDGRRMRERREI